MRTEKHRVVLVTGASSGFGQAIADALVRDGHIVYGTYRQNAPSNPTFRPIGVDVTRDESVDRAVAGIARDAGRLDVVINNAGMGIAGAIEDTSVDEAKAQFDTNFFGVHRVCRAVLPLMRNQRAGLIVNMSSLAGRVPIPFQAFYSATKFAVEAYSETLRMEVRPFGIKVAMVEPGDFATSFTANRRMSAESGDKSPYKETCTRAIAQMEHDEQANKDLSPVVDAVREIIQSEDPALRWPRAVAAQRLGVALSRFIPQRAWESLMRKTYGLS